MVHWKKLFVGCGRLKSESQASQGNAHEVGDMRGHQHSGVRQSLDSIEHFM